MQELTRRKTGRIPGLDGLRAVAVTGIVLYHMFPGAVRGGYLGVTLFFVLSGFLLARTALRAEEGQGFHAGRFYLRRLRRIYPALLWTMALTLLALRIWMPAPIGSLRAETVSALLGVQNWRLIRLSQDYFTRITATTPLTHLWSLMVELQFYLVWPLLFGMARLERRESGDTWATVSVLLALALVSAVGMGLVFYLTEDAARVYYGTDARAHALLLGAALGLIPPESLRLGRRSGIALFALCAAGLLALMALLDGRVGYAYYGLMQFSAVLCAALVALCAQADLPFGRALEVLPLRWLGQRSYECYLVMYPALFLLERLRPVPDGAPLHLLEAAVILALAALIHRLSQPGALFAPAGADLRKRLLRPALWALTLAVGAGIWAAAAPLPRAEGAESLEALRVTLEENRRVIERQAAEATPVIEDPADVTLVGDSVLLSCLPALQERLPGCVVDAETSRQVWDVIPVLDALEADGRLRSTVVISLGTNGAFLREEGERIVERLGPDRQILWITSYGASLTWQDETNDMIRDIAAAHENVRVVDWAAAAPGHEDWFYVDGIHPEPPGQRAYADLIADALGWPEP